MSDPSGLGPKLDYRADFLLVPAILLIANISCSIGSRAPGPTEPFTAAMIATAALVCAGTAAVAAAAITSHIAAIQDKEINTACQVISGGVGILVTTLALGESLSKAFSDKVGAVKGISMFILGLLMYGLGQAC